MEAGWIVRSGDPQTHFFIFWTRDGYKTTGCYNLDCPGFVQVNRQFALGSIVNPVSSYNGLQFNILITIFKNKESGNWWLQLQNQVLGYWPGSIFTTLADSSDAINFGGEIINDEADGHHTPTQMGSGHFPSEGYGKASFFGNLQYMDSNGVFKDPEKLIPYVTKPLCYDLQVRDEKTSASGTYFYFGGPGYSEKCLN
ncbi:hypothetical protein TorRG33x02_244950 [Trema orientale]|uniref:Neprosin PEP catalytic domain-containing protein n=1 Tax=Trema orientale TaxID=63057 RepID=A0A2P5DQU2_TREOI|nr:hypothetical protein TorRG33x02_244950 [Trema orientale]